MFDDAIDYLVQYRTDHLDGLRNVKPMRWFTSPSDTLADVTGTFESDNEDDDWEKMDQSKDPVDLLAYQAVRMQVGFMAGIRHDLRGQFSVGVNADPKTGCDFDRHAFGDTLGARWNTNQLAVVVASRLQGGGGQ